MNDPFFEVRDDGTMTRDALKGALYRALVEELELHVMLTGGARDVQVRLESPAIVARIAVAYQQRITLARVLGMYGRLMEPIGKPERVYNAEARLAGRAGVAHADDYRALDAAVAAWREEALGYARAWLDLGDDGLPRVYDPPGPGPEIDEEDLPF